MHNGSFRRFGGYLRTRWASPRRIRFWVLVLVVLYTLLGFFVLPWVIQYVAVNTVREDLGRELHIESIQTNPYTLRLQVNGLHLDDTDDQLLFGWEQLEVNLAWSSLVNRRWTFPSIHLNQALVQEERFASGETRFLRLTEALTEEDSDDEPPPALHIEQLRVTGGTLHFFDNLEDERDDASELSRVGLELQDIQFTLDDFSLHEAASSPVQLEGTFAGGGVLSFEGVMQHLPDFTLEGSARIDQLALTQADPYLRQLLNVHLGSGSLSLRGAILSDPEQPFAFQGSGSIEALEIKDGDNEETLIGWLNLQADQLDLNLAENRVETGYITVDGLFGQVIIYRDQSTNFSPLLESIEADEEDPDIETEPFDITIDRIELREGGFLFADYSLPLFFSADIRNLHGHISTLSATSDEPAEVDLEGQVEEVGMASIEGSIQIWDPTKETDLELNFQNLQIPQFSPYTLEFASRPVEDGEMDVNLGYTIEDGQLEGRNNLVLRSLRIGDEIDSDGLLDLPLNFALSLLEDGDGVIDLDLPVSGDVGDPEFDYGQVILDAVRSVILSIVEAPFRFLAELVGADSEDFGQVDFEEGASELQPPQLARIGELREALSQRPALFLELAGPFNREFDGDALKRNKAIETLKQHLDDEDRNDVEPSLTTEANQEIVEAMFNEHYPDVDLEALQTRFTEEEDDDNGFDGLAYRNHLADRIIEVKTITDEDLKALGNERATAVRDALIDEDSEHRIAAERIRILEPQEIDSVDEERIVMEMSVEAE